MTDKVFIDSNVWIYSLIEAEAEREKRQCVIKLLENLTPRGPMVVSLQVLNETHWTLQRRYAVKEERIREHIRGIIAITNVLPLTLPDYLDAYDLRDQYSLSFWDSLIIAVALRAGCCLLYSEDMQHDLRIREKLLIQNPLM